VSLKRQVPYETTLKSKQIEVPVPVKIVSRHPRW
jgi:hypothetical protein